MSRTWKVSADWRTRTTNSTLQMGCGRGKGCGVCGSLERYSDKVRETVAREKAAESPWVRRALSSTLPAKVLA